MIEFIAKIRAWWRWRRQTRNWNKMSNESRKLIHFLGGFPPAHHWRDRGAHWPVGHKNYQSWNEAFAENLRRTIHELGTKS